MIRLSRFEDIIQPEQYRVLEYLSWERHQRRHRLGTSDTQNHTKFIPYSVRYDICNRLRLLLLWIQMFNRGEWDEIIGLTQAMNLRRI